MLIDITPQLNSQEQKHHISLYKDLRDNQQHLFNEKQTLHALMDLKYTDAAGHTRQRLLEVDRQILRHINMWTNKAKCEQHNRNVKRNLRAEGKTGAALNDYSKFYDERYWMFNSFTEIAEIIHRSPLTVKRSVKKLHELGYIFIKQLHRKKGNRTNFYTINYEKIYSEIENHSHCYKGNNISLFQECKNGILKIKEFLATVSTAEIVVSPVAPKTLQNFTGINSISSNNYTEGLTEFFISSRYIKNSDLEQKKEIIKEKKVESGFSPSSSFYSDDDDPALNPEWGHISEYEIIVEEIQNELSSEIYGGSPLSSLQEHQEPTFDTASITTSLVNSFRLKSSQSWCINAAEEDLSAMDSELENTSLLQNKDQILKDLAEQRTHCEARSSYYSLQPTEFNKKEISTGPGSVQNAYKNTVAPALDNWEISKNTLETIYDFDNYVKESVTERSHDEMGDEHEYNYGGSRFKPKTESNWVRNDSQASSKTGFLAERVVTGESEYCRNLREKLKKHYGIAVYKSWLQDQDYIFYPDIAELHIICQTRFIKDWLKSNYLNSLEGIIISGYVRKVTLLLTEEESRTENKKIMTDMAGEEPIMKSFRKSLLDEIGLIDYTVLFQNVRMVKIGDILCICEPSDRFKFKRQKVFKDKLLKLAHLHKFSDMVQAVGYIKVAGEKEED